MNPPPPRTCAKVSSVLATRKQNENFADLQNNGEALTDAVLVRKRERERGEALW